MGHSALASVALRCDIDDSASIESFAGELKAPKLSQYGQYNQFSPYGQHGQHGWYGQYDQGSQGASPPH